MIRTGQRWFLADAHRVRGEILLKFKPSDVEAAEAAFTQAIEVARGQSAKRFEFRAAMQLARLWTDQGKPTAHQGLLAILSDGLADGSEFDGFSETEILSNDSRLLNPNFLPSAVVRTAHLDC